MSLAYAGTCRERLTGELFDVNENLIQTYNKTKQNCFKIDLISDFSIVFQIVVLDNSAYHE